MTAFQIASLIHHQFNGRIALQPVTLGLGILCALIHVVVGVLLGLYRRDHRRGSLDEAFELGFTIVLTGLAWTVCAGAGSWFTGARMTDSLSLALLAGPLALNLMFVVRLANRSRLHRQVQLTTGRERVVVMGAGSGGRLLIRSMFDDPSSPYVPVAILDDDQKKQGMAIDGVRIRGTHADLAKVAADCRAAMVVIAIPSADGQLVRQLHHSAQEAGLRPLLLPSLPELLGRRPTAADIRDLNLEDLLGRRTVTLDENLIGESIRGKSVLVTGAGGSIGSELCRQIARFRPRDLIMLDRDESALHATQLLLDGNGLLQNDNLVLADIRDGEVLERVFAQRRPDVVFHAAALKHLPLLESHPLEAWKTNVVGTLNVLRAASTTNVRAFVNISTDKAANPTSVLGYSKRIAERLTAHYANLTGFNYLSVRFGNVLGSRGSVIPAFTAQIRQGGPITITHPDVKRYFMLIPEACQLVMQAATMSKPGEVMVLDMGEQIRIKDMAETLIDFSGRDDIEISFTGLRPGEKLEEELFSNVDEVRRTPHPLVTSVDVPPLPGQAVARTPVSGDQAVPLMRTWAANNDDVVISIDQLRITAS